MLRSVFGPRIGCFVAQNAFFGARRMGMVTMTRSEGSLLGGMVPLARPMGNPLSSLIGSPLTSPLGTPEMHLDSVMRKRRTKMKKHKLRKRRKRQKAEKRKQSQG